MADEGLAMLMEAARSQLVREKLKDRMVRALIVTFRAVW